MFMFMFCQYVLYPEVPFNIHAEKKMEFYLKLFSSQPVQIQSSLNRNFNPLSGDRILNGYRKLFKFSIHCSNLLGMKHKIFFIFPKCVVYYFFNNCGGNNFFKIM